MENTTVATSFKKAADDVTRTEIRRRVHEEPCDAGTYGEVVDDGTLSPPFYKSLANLTALMAPLEMGLKDVKDMGEVLTKEARDRLDVVSNDNDSACQQPIENISDEFVPTEEECVLFSYKQNWPKLVKAMTGVARDLIGAQIIQAEFVNSMIDRIEKETGKLENVNQSLTTDALEQDMFKELQKDLIESMKNTKDEEVIKLLKNVVYYLLGVWAKELSNLTASIKLLDLLWTLILKDE